MKNTSEAFLKETSLVCQDEIGKIIYKFFVETVKKLELLKSLQV